MSVKGKKKWTDFFNIKDAIYQGKRIVARIFKNEIHRLEGKKLCRFSQKGWLKKTISDRKLILYGIVKG
jgi:hypothetical protein